jgi:LPXTG-motif cell wall-anchored protein
MNRNVSRLTRAWIGAGLVLLAVGIVAAQETTIEIRNGTVLSVTGNRLVVRGPEGVRAFDVPSDFLFNTADGRQVTIAQLTPGMPISAIIKTTETAIPMSETVVKEGEVVHTVGSAFVVRTSDGQMKKFVSKDIEAKNIVIIRARDGQPVSPWDLKAGDNISATIVTELPPQIITESELAVFVEQPPAPKPVVVAQAPKAPAPPPPPPAAAAPPPAPPAPPPALPKTGSRLPWLAVFGLGSLAVGAALTIRRFLLSV